MGFERVGAHIEFRKINPLWIGVVFSRSHFCIALVTAVGVVVRGSYSPQLGSAGCIDQPRVEINGLDIIGGIRIQITRVNVVI